MRKCIVRKSRSCFYVTNFLELIPCSNSTSNRTYLNRKSRSRNISCFLRFYILQQRNEKEIVSRRCNGVLIWQIIKFRITPLFMWTLEQRHGDKVQDFDMLDVGSQSNKEIPTENTVLGLRRLYPRSVLICILYCSAYLGRIQTKNAGCLFNVEFSCFAL